MYNSGDGLPMKERLYERFLCIKERIPQGVKLVVVTKKRTKEELDVLYPLHRVWGENRVQELTEKKEMYGPEVEWHMIGHLQTNKVKYIAPFISLIHSVDSYRLLEEINKQAQKYNRVVPVLLQVHIAEETTKHGFAEHELYNMLRQEQWRQLLHIQMRGVMGMATYTDDAQKIRKEFRRLRNIFETIKKEHFADSSYFCEVSMGMSNDYRIAIEEGTTMVRLGSVIFEDQ